MNNSGSSGDLVVWSAALVRFEMTRSARKCCRATLLFATYRFASLSGECVGQVVQGVEIPKGFGSPAADLHVEHLGVVQ